MSVISRTMAAGVAVAILAFSSQVSAALITGTPSPNPSFGTNYSNYSYQPTNTNLFNSANGLHYVHQTSSGVGSVELTFVNPTAYTAYFEYRVDGQSSQWGTTYPHSPAFTSGEYYYWYYSVAPNASSVHLFTGVNQNVEIRSAFGPERDWDFDWTRFEAVPAPVPLPAAAWLLLSGLAGMGFIGRRRKPA